MRGVRNIYYHFCTFSLLYFVVLILLFPAFSISVNILSSTESLTISSNRTIVSPGGVFELGFFKPGTSSRWYLGIWYKTIFYRSYVWVANRDSPLSNPAGTLKISDTNLVISDHTNTSVWSTNLTRGDVRSTVVAELLANGNFVLRYSNNNDPSRFLWQSFHFPTDTLLPQMKIGWERKTKLNRFLKSWRSPDDPSSGEFSYMIETLGSPQFFLWQGDIPTYRSGPWNGVRFNGMSEMQELDYMVYNFTENREEVDYTFLMTNHSTYSRLTVTPTGNIEQYTWVSEDGDRNLLWISPKDQCDLYRLCGPYSLCDTVTLLCDCIIGFKPNILEAWAEGDGVSGCVRKTLLSCNGGDGFLQLKKMKLPDTKSAIVDRRIGLKECEEKCLSNCNCTAFANANIQNGGSGCVMWIGELFDIRNYLNPDQDLYVRLAAADMAFSAETRNIKGKIIGSIVGIGVALLVSFIIFYIWKRKRKQTNAIPAPIERNQELLITGEVIPNRRHFSGENDTEDLELPLIPFESVTIATENFSCSNRLGQGGFGVVYKGRLLDGQEIAVKRLSQMSLQGTTEFMNEVKLIAKLQHINLVRLFGCCIDAGEKILIYEYLENLSLDSYIFDKTRSSKLNWQKRFDVTNGIARGLLYLHQDSRCRIIHRDLKASNVLLDKDMIPKISDFGMARIFARDEMAAVTRKVVGTHGYMSPEYAMDGVFSVKSDVFSFGVLLLEIVSGKKNRGFYNSNQDNNLLAYTWRNWKEGKCLEIVDPVIVDSSSPFSSFRPQEAQRCIQIGLLCIQEHALDRPTMSSVVFMLGNETAAIPQPKTPGYCVGRSPLETESSSSEEPKEESWTMNHVTDSIIDAR